MSKIIGEEQGVTVEETKDGEQTLYAVRRGGRLVGAFPDRHVALRFAFRPPTGGGFPGAGRGNNGGETG